VVGKNIDEHMVEDLGHRAEIERTNAETAARKAVAKTPEELEDIRREAIERYRQADYARYDKAKQKALRHTR